MSDYILEMRNITKEFFGVKALDNVELKVKRGEIHCIVGENGAGKSTLMNILSGTYPYGSYSGDIVYDNEICQFRNIKDSEGKGIVIIHQELALIPGLSVAENLFLGNERQSHGIIDWDRTNEEAKKWLDMVAFKEEATRLVKDVGIGAQQLIEIAKALAKNVKLLILDEPTAALPETEARHLLNLLKELQKQGLTSIIITHKLNEVCYVGDRVTIIRDGCTVGGLSEEEKPFLEDIIVKGMVGREMLHRYPERPDHFVKPEVGFEIREWNTFHPTYAEQQIVKNASLKVHKGEIVGLYGLMGAGRTEMAMSVFGRSYGQKTSGRIFKAVSYTHLQVTLALAGGHEGPGPGGGVFDEGAGKGDFRLVGVTHRVGDAGVRDAGHNVGADVIFLIPAGQEASALVAHLLHVDPLVGGGGIAVVDPEEGADFHLLPGGTEYFHALWRDEIDLPRPQFL